MSPSDSVLSRRAALSLGGGIGATTLVGGLLAPEAQASTIRVPLPVDAIQDALGAEGTYSDGVLDVSVDREDIGTLPGPLGVPFKPAFELNHEFYFQMVRHHKAISNGQFSLKLDEVDRVVDEILKQGLDFQAHHQHYMELTPTVWFVHYRGVGEPVAVARAIRAVMDVTSTPLPQSPPANPTTPLPVSDLEDILGGTADVGSDGVVTVTVSRSSGVRLGGYHVSPDLGISTTVSFEPLGDGRAAVAPDFSMLSSEIDPVTRKIRSDGFHIGCLYNQETDEKPQLFFMHALKVGDARAIARQVRAALELTDVDFT